MTKEQAIAKLNEILGENVEEQFEEKEEHASAVGNVEFLISNENNTAVQVETVYDEDTDMTEYKLNENWAG